MAHEHAHAGLHHHESAVYEASIVVVLLAEGVDIIVPVHIQDAELLPHVNRSDRGDLPVLFVERQQRGNIHIRHPVAVGQHEGLTAHIVPDPLDAAAGHGVKAGVHQRHLPRLRVVVVHLHLVVGQVEGHIRGVQEIVGEKFLHHVLLVPQTDHELVESELGIVFHNVPENGPLADLDHGLRLQMALLADSCPEAAG